MTGGNGPLLALDFGGTKLSAAVPEGSSVQWRSLRRRLSPPGADAASDISTAIELGREALDGERPAAVGVSFGGPVWASRGVVKLSHHVPGWEGVALAERLQEEFSAPAFIENDGIIAALGEHRYGSGREFDSLLYLTVSTGVGGGMILGGRIWHGADGMAGHVGHIRLEPDGPLCVCGSRGCLESIAAGPAIAAHARELALTDMARGIELLRSAGVIDDRMPEPNLATAAVEALTARDVAIAAAAGDELAREVLHRAGRALGIAIGSAANVVNPDLVLVGGGVSKAGEPLWGPLRELARETAMPEVTLRVERAGLGDDAPLWGAVALARESIGELPERQVQ